MPTFAVGLDGTVYVDLRGLDGVEDVEGAVKAMEDGERCFIGIAIKPKDRRRLLRHLADAGMERAAFVLGARRSRKRS